MPAIRGPTVAPSLPLGSTDTTAPSLPGPFGQLIGAMLNTPYWQNQYAANPGGVASASSPAAMNALSMFFPSASGGAASSATPLGGANLLNLMGK